MFRKHRDGSNVLPEGNQAGGRAAGISDQKSRKPVFRTLEPRMVFDAAATVAVEQAGQAPAHHEPAADAEHHAQPATSAWNHMDAALKAAPAPVTPVDKPALTDGPALAPVEPVSAGKAIGEATGLEAPATIAGTNTPGAAGQALATDAKATGHAEPIGLPGALGSAAATIGGAADETQAPAHADLAGGADHQTNLPEALKATPLSPSDTRTDRSGAIDLPDARPLAHEAGIVLAAAPAERLETRTTDVAAELAPKVAREPTQADPAVQISPPSTVEVASDMLSNAARWPGTAADVANEPHLPAASDRVVTDPRAGDARSADTKSVDVTAAAETTEPARTEVFFIWDNVQDWQQIVASLGSNARVYVLDASKDGVEQIAAALKGQSNIGALHIISHGSEGSLTLGTAVLDAESMQGEYRDELETIGQALSQNGDILIYGCDFAAGADGLQAATILSGITQADVAASTDATGAAARGGDWTLEEHTGAIETPVFADYDYQFLLANPAVDLNGTQIGNNTTVGYVEQAAPASIVAAGAADGATATDADNDLQSISIVANAAPNGNSEHLTFAGTPIALGTDSITTVTVAGTAYNIVYTASTRTFVITNSAGGNIPSGGATNVLIRSITYDNSSDNPTNGGLNANRIFTFTATDAAGGSSAGRTATVNITAVNDNPVDSDETRTVTEDVTLSAPAESGLLANASDPDGNPLMIASYTIAGIAGTQTVGSAVAIAGVGTITINADGSYNFAPTANFNGTIPVITYTVSDGAGGTDTSTLTLTMVAVNDAPAGTDNTVTIGEDAAYTFSAASFGFTDPGDTPANGFQAVIITTLPPASQGTLLLSGVAVTAGQTIALADIPNLTFQPAANVNGNGVGSFTFQVVDDGGTANGGQNTDQSPNTFAFNIAAANDAPVGTDNAVTITEDTSYTFTAASFGFADPNDSPANGFQAVIITTLPPAAQGTLLLNGVPVTAGQTIAAADIPNLTFQPAADVNGTGVGSFTFQVVDDGGTANGGQNTDQSPNTFSFNITAVNDPPVANDDTTTTPEDTTLNGNVLANDTDVDGDTLTVTQFSALNVTAVAGQTGTIPGVGQITINADGTYTFVPVADFNGPVPTITYTITDGHGGTDTATLNITVVSVNDPPIDGNETNAVVEDTTLTVADGSSGDLLNNASDSDGGTPTITDYTIPGVNGGNPIIAGTATLIPGVGTITINANGSYSFVPVADYDGAIPVITYTVSDGQGGTDTSTLTLTMTPVNDAPVGTDDATTTPENTPVSGNVLTNDTDVDSTNLTVTFFTIDGTTYGAGTTAAIPGVGTLVINTDGSYTFTPAPNYDGPVPTATYTVSDGQLTDTALLTITITPENDPPIATDDTGTTPEDTTLSVPASSGLLANDTDVDGDALSVTQFVVGGTTYTAGQTATIPGVGGLTINADGSYTFVPAPNYNGPVPVVTYTVSDGNGGTDQGMLTLNVTPVNDPPVAVDDTGTTPEDTPLSGNVLGNDTDPDTGDTLTVVGFTVNGNTFIAGATATLPEGTITVNADGSYTLVPAANYNGPVPVITYTVQDENGTRTTATLTLDVTPVNDPPVANDDNASTPQDTTLSGNVIDNDSDVDGDTIVVTEYTIPGVNGGNPIPAGTATPIPGVGTITVNPDGSYIFVPAPGYVGPVPEIDYTISDGNGGTDQGALNIDVIPIGGAGANDDVATTPEDTTLTGNVVSNDVSPDNNPISVVDFTVDGATYQPGDTAHLAQGDLTIEADGSYTFVPAPDYFGPVPVVTYTATNGAASDTATLTITVTPVDDPPIAVDDTGTTPEDTTLTGNVLTNDTDIDNATLTVTEFSVNGITATAGQTGTIPGVGQITVNANGSYTFVPAPDYNGPVPVITYTVSDGTLTDTATLTITVTPVNDPPVAVDDTGTTPEDTTLTGNVLTNDTDVDNATLTVTGFQVGFRTFTAGQTATIPLVGALTINADGSYTFVPAPNYNGPVPVVTYTVSDGALTDTATLTITVTPVNDAPVANDDTATLAEDTTLTVPAASGLLANDSDVDNATLTVEGFEVSGVLFGAGTTANIPGVGALTIEADGSYTFTPVLNFNGPVPPVTYRVSDGNGGTATAVLTITVTPVNDPPVDGNETNTVTEDTTLTVGSAGAAGNLLNNATDVDGIDTLTITDYSIPGVNGGNPITAGTATLIPGVGTIAINTDGSYTFAPAQDYTGPVPVITYTVSDNAGGTDTSTLTLTITPVNDPPVARNDLVSTPEDTTLTGNVLGNDVDVDGDTLTVDLYQVAGFGGFLPGAPATIPGVGTLTINADGSYTFVPVANYNGPVPVATYRIVDPSGLQSTADLIIIVTPVDDPPVDGDETNTVTEDTPLTVPAASGLLANTTDIDGGTPSVVGYTVDGLTGTIGSDHLIAGVGTITINADGSYSFVPVANYAGPIPVITYTVSDNAGGTDTSTLTLTMIPVNDPPGGADRTVTIAEDTAYIFSAGDFGFTDPNDNPANALQAVIITTLPPASDGTLLLNGVAVTAGQTIAVADIPNLTFQPAADVNGIGIGAFTFQVVDNGGTANGGQNTDQSPNRFAFNIAPVNDPPVDGDETNTVIEDTTLTVTSGEAGDLLNNATDVEGDTLTVTSYTIAGMASTQSVGGPVVIAGVGTITINADGSYSFAPAADYTGPIPVITYTVSDGHGGTDTSTLTLTITPVNDPPVANDDTGTTPEDTTLTGNVLTNDSDVDGDPLSVTQFVVDGTTYTAGQTATIAGVGALTIGADGSYTFVPAANYNGPVPVATYTISDGALADTATLTITVTPVNDPPVAVDDTGTTPEDTTLTGNVLTNDSDVDGDPLSVTQFVVDGTTYTAGQTATIAGVGALTIGADGSYTFVPAANYNGPVPVATYTISDGALADTATLTITVTPVNDPPVANDDTGTTPEDTTLTGNVLTNDSDVDGDPLSVTQFVVDGTTYTAGQTATIAGVGALTIGADGSYTFVPAANYNGPVPVATYTISDGTLADTATLTITVTPVNDPPVAVDDTGTTPEDTTLTGNVLTNDSDVDGDPLSVTQFVVDGTTYTAGQTATIAGVGALTIGADGSYTFVPAANYNGPVPVATYTISDGALADTATLTITVTPVNDPPVANDDTGTTPEDTTLTGNVLTNDSDVDGDPLSVTQFVVDGTTYTAGQTATIAGVGALTIGADGSYTFVPAANYNGPVPVATYTISDGALADTATLTITVTPVNDPPVANDDTGTTPEDTTLTGNVLTNDSDVDGDPLSVTQFVVDGTTYTAGQTATIAGVGALTIGADGSYTFVPAANYNGPVPVATYTISDGTLVDTATLTITVTPVNDPPVANDDFGTTPEDTTLTVPAASGLLSNDTDVEGDTLTVTRFTVTGVPGVFFAGQTAAIAGVGQLTINADGSYTFVPALDFNGLVPLATYTVSDGNGGTATATLRMIVTPVNDPPVADNEIGITREDTPLVVEASNGLLVGDTDVDGGTLSVTQFEVDGATYSVGQTATIAGIGRLTVNANGSYVFVPAPDYDGPVPVATYTVSDGRGGTDTATLTILVTPVNDPPIATDDAATTPEEIPVSGNVLANDTDIDGGLLTVAQFEIGGTVYAAGDTATIADVGQLTISADGSYTFVPVLNFNGPVPVATYTVSDGRGGTDTAALAITVTPVNDPPVAVDDTGTTPEDTTLIGNVLTNDSDVDGDPLTVTQFEINGARYASGQTATIAGIGSLTINADGSYIFVPAPDYNGPVPVATYTISDGAGGTDAATLTLTVTPVDDFVPIPDDNPPEPPIEPDTPYDPEHVDGAVVEAARGLDDLNDTADLSERAIDAAVKGLETPARLSLSTFLGGSSTIVVDRLAGDDERVQVEAIKHTGIIYLQIIEETKGSEQAAKLSYRLRSADGSPAPAWLRQIGPQTFAGHPDADAGVVDLILSVIQRDGRVSDHKLQLDSFSGHLSQPLEPQKQGFEGRLAPMFSEQMNEGSRDQNINLLERALGFLQ